ncbi:MAG: arylesterase [Kiloniellales bacterium]
MTSLTKIAALLAATLAAAVAMPGASGPPGPPAWAAEPMAQAWQGRPLVILAFGDSLTHGYGLPAGATFPERLQAELLARGYRVRVINGGNSGDTTAGGRARLAWALADRPDLVLLELGANDALRGLDPAVTYENLDAILNRLEREGLAVLFTGMRAPLNMGRNYGAAFEAVFARLAAEHGVPFYPFFLEGVAMVPALNQADGIHPNASGVGEIVKRIAPRVIRLLRGLIEPGQESAVIPAPGPPRPWLATHG